MTQTTDVVWTMTAPWAQTFSTTVIGIAVAYVAWRQWQTARHKLALDLFDKRYQAYDVITRFYLLKGNYRNLKRPTDEEFLQVAAQTKFLFGADVFEPLSRLANHQQEKPIGDTPEDQEWNALLDEVRLKMTRYMQLHKAN